MAAAARERLDALLRELGTPGSFSARRTAPADDLAIKVRGVGPLAMPVPVEQAKLLCSLGKPARYGRGTETLTDRRVRHTWQIPTSRVVIDKRRWNRTLHPVVDGLRADLGLPATCSLKAELHSLLVYERGQFFVAHRDSEKDDSMVGTLVVTLPAAGAGGDLVVHHGNESATYRAARQQLTFVAFYADCRHEVRPVKSGHRIVLTYNLLLSEPAQGSPSLEVPPGAVAAAARCIEEHFTAANGGAPTRLVHLLDHEYTRRSLSWARLKGPDALRAEVMRQAAGAADCEVVLALADIHETWSAYEPDRRPRYGAARGRSRYDPGLDEDDEGWPGERDAEPETGDYELDELIDRTITLDSWLDPSSMQTEPVSTSVHDEEVCSTSPSHSCAPCHSEYEGYMGNYGTPWTAGTTGGPWPSGRDGWRSPCVPRPPRSGPSTRWRQRRDLGLWPRHGTWSRPSPRSGPPSPSSTGPTAFSPRRCASPLRSTIRDRLPCSWGPSNWSW